MYFLHPQRGHPSAFHAYMCKIVCCRILYPHFGHTSMVPPHLNFMLKVVYKFNV